MDTDLLQPWVREFCEDNVHLLALAADLRAPGARQTLQTELLGKLDSTVFQAMFFHVRNRIDFRRTKDRPDGQGIYFIQNNFLNVTINMMQLWASEKPMNLSNTTGPKGEPQLRQANFVAWALVNEFKYCDKASFTKLDQDVQRPSSRFRPDVERARESVFLSSPPPPPPPGTSSSGLSPSPSIGNSDMADVDLPGLFDDSPILN
ncbi:hypothetical protein FDECE_1270 [Fusarium decemcellulare]|nr:hypothetical protein FDECE_1270 [Fusarium decemcellulare]